MTAVSTPPLHVTCFYVRRPHFGRYSGIHQFVKHLNPSDVQVTERGVGDHDDDLPPRWPWRSPVSRRAWRTMTSGVGPRWYKLSDFAAELATAPAWWRQETHVLHFIDGEHTANLLPWLARRIRSRGRTVATYHQSPAILPGLVPRRVVERLDHVTVVASTQRAWFEQVLPANRVSVILHGVDTTYFHPAAPRHPGRTVRCIVVGSYLRDWELLERIAVALKDDDSLAIDVVSSSAPDFPALPAVTVHRKVSDESLRDLYHHADLLLLPLRDATANNALLEGMACGLPCIGTDLPSLREYAGDGTGVFVPHNQDAYVDAIRSLAGDPELRTRLGAAARTRAEALSWPSIAPSYAAVYRRLAGVEIR